jgi:hypothetical protein
MTAKKGAGRPAGSPNKATATAREAIAAFVDGNAYRLTEWLDAVAHGVKVEKENPETGEVETNYLVPPNPAKAFDMFQSVVEYHIPKLARTELTGGLDVDVKADVSVDVFGELLDNLLMQKQDAKRSRD